MYSSYSSKTCLTHLDNMFRHLSRPTRALAALAAAFLASFLRPSAASAQSLQVFINTSYVASIYNTNINTGCTFSSIPGGPPRFQCYLSPTATVSNSPSLGANLSNDPEIQFASDGIDRCNISNPNGSDTNNTAAETTNLNNANPNISGTNGYNVCNDQLLLCTQVGLDQVTGQTAIDSVEFDVFKFTAGSNALDPTSTPPLKTFFIDVPGTVSPGSSATCTGTLDLATGLCDSSPYDGTICTAMVGTASSSATASCTLPDSAHSYCVLWDGSQNVQGGTGKINGQYGFRVTVQTSQTGVSGTIQLTAVRAFPSGATFDANGDAVASKNITMNVTDVHVILSTPTLVGQITPVAAEPYNFSYRLSRDALMYITINSSLSPFNNIRTVVAGLPRVGEGVLSSPTSVAIYNSDFWDGRDLNGNIMPPGNYLAVFQADSSSQYDFNNPSSYPLNVDLSLPTTTQISLDPLQITDIRVTPLLGGSTSLAVLNYTLTEAATVYMDVYPPGTTFCNDSNNLPALSDVNSTVTDGVSPAKNFQASSNGCNVGYPYGATTPVAPLFSVAQAQTFRTPVFSFWNGQNSNGNLVGDGDYVFVLYASLPSQAQGTKPYNGHGTDTRVWTSVAKIGFLSVLRGLVGVTQIVPSSTVIGSSPAIAGLSPFTFRYQLSRDAIVSVKIFDATGTRLIKTLVNQEVRPGLFNNAETWTDGNGDNGLAVASGTYIVQLTAADETFLANITTTTAIFPLDNFRITDVSVTPLLSSASGFMTLSYQLSQPMLIAWNIYPPGSVIVNNLGLWPPCPNNNPPTSCTSSSVVSPGGTPVAPIITFQGMRAGRLLSTEFWDGRDINGLFLPDGNYVYTLSAVSTTTPAYFPTDHVFGNLTMARGPVAFTSFAVSPNIVQLFNSSDTIELPPYTINYTLTRQSSVTIQILTTAIPPQVLRTVILAAVRQNGILLTDIWDGLDDHTNFLPFAPGGSPYLVQALAQEVAAPLLPPATEQLTVLYDPLRIYDLAVTPNQGNGAKIDYQLSEPMKVSIKVYYPNTSFDLSGNPTPPEVDAQGHYVSLVRRIVGMRPALTKIEDIWDGRDMALQLVPDGTYKFRIVASTDTNAIDTITGNVIYPTELADDQLLTTIPSITEGASSDPAADFESNSFVYPNPVVGPTGTFSIYTPFQGRVLLKLYTISGQLVLSQDFGEQPPSYQNGPVIYVWNKVNQSGRTIARGLYYAVIRLEETVGGGSVLQTVKKVLVP
jgi:flagellar hook assembly protein FlgD